MGNHFIYHIPWIYCYSCLFPGSSKFEQQQNTYIPKFKPCARRAQVDELSKQPKPDPSEHMIRFRKVLNASHAAAHKEWEDKANTSGTWSYSQAVLPKANLCRPKNIGINSRSAVMIFDGFCAIEIVCYLSSLLTFRWGSPWTLLSLHTRSGTLTNMNTHDVSFNPSISVACSKCAGGQGATSMLTTTFPIEPLVQLFDLYIKS